MLGRFVVLLIENNFVTVSHKIQNKDEQERLKEIVQNSLKDTNIGAIVRTSAEGKTKEEIEKDIEIALKKLKYVKEQYEKLKNNAPSVILKSDTILDKILLDLIDNNLNRIVVNDKNLHDKIKEKIFKIDENSKVKIDLQEKNILDTYELNSQIEKLANRKIWLKCGGFITIDKTEALTAIDVNSGKFTGKKDLETTVLRVNKEASIEIAKQLRLRDIGGIIVIDYIDMFEEESKKQVIETLKEALKKDRAKVQVLDFTKLGLLEISRKHMFSKE